MRRAVSSPQSRRVNLITHVFFERPKRSPFEIPSRITRTSPVQYALPSAENQSDVHLHQVKTMRQLRKRNRQLLLAATYFSLCTHLSFSFRTCWRARPPTIRLHITKSTSSDLHVHVSDEDKSSVHASDGFLAVDTTKQDFRALGKTTRELLNSTEVGEWNRSSFETVEAVMAAWSKANSKSAALMAERLLRRVVLEQMSGNPDADRLDMTALYTILIQAWANSGATGGAERAEEILDYLQDIYEKGDSDDPLLCGPGLECFNAIIYGYARTGRQDAPEQAMRVLRKLYDLNRAKRTLAVPSKNTYAGVLRACARTENGPEVIRKLLDHMETLSLTYPLVKPDYRCHNAYLYALLEGINQGNKHIPGPKAALMADEYLHGMLANPDKEVHVSLQIVSEYRQIGRNHWLTHAPLYPDFFIKALLLVFQCSFIGMGPKWGNRHGRSSRGFNAGARRVP